MIKIKAIDHVVLRTTRLDAMLEFYCGVLNCPVERELSADIGLVQLRAGAGLIDLVPVDSKLGALGGRAPQQDGRNVDHFCLTLEAITETEVRDLLHTAGIATEPFQKRYGAAGFGQSIYVEDPEGNVVELKLDPD